MNGAVMKSVVIRSVKFVSLLFLFAALAATAAQAQEVKLQLSQLDKLEARATESVDVSLDGSLLRLATPFLKDSDPKEKAIKDLVGGLKGVYVKVYQFDKEGEYSVADVDSVRTQLRSPAWARMVGVKSKKEGEKVDVYMKMNGTQIGGIAVIATNPKQFTVVNIIGSLDLEKLVQLSGRFGIPSLDINLGSKEPKE
jgi:hypothetical protein